MKTSSFFKVVLRRVRGGQLRRPPRTKPPTKHYLEHKEVARAFIHERLMVVNKHYQVSYNRVAIRDQKSRWGSCSTKGNLNFSYRLMFLPLHLADYVVAHELSHLKEFNHSPAFWKLVEGYMPEYRRHKAVLARTAVRRGMVVQRAAPAVSEKDEDLL